MRKFTFLAVLFVLLVSSATQSQTLNYPFAAADYQAGTLTAFPDSLKFTASNAVTFVSVTIDTTTKVVCTPASHITNGALLYIEITAPATANQTITWSGLTAASATITKSKTVVYSFVYRSGYKLFATQQIN